MFATDLKCTDCTTSFPLDEKIVHCTNCRSVLDIVYDLDRIRRNSNKGSLKNRVHSLWRYREFLPISRDDCIVSLGEGFTPLTEVSRYAGEMGLSRLAVKLDYLNPTGSFKDRGTTVNVTQLRAMGINAVMDDSSGNAGSSLAAYCAAAGIRCTLYVPATAPSEKLLQAEVYGAKILKINGTRTDVAKAAETSWKTSGLFYASHNLSPFFFEGMKTVAYEIAEDLDWQVPDHVVFPVGGGALLAGATKGFKELNQLGWTDRVPKIHCVQAEACMPIVEAYRKGSMLVTPCIEGETVAGGIRIANPARGKQVLEAILQTGGQALSVTDDAILMHQKLLAQKEGLFAEPTSCAALAGVEKLLEIGTIGPRDQVIVPLTGFGLKDTKSAAKSLSL